MYLVTSPIARRPPLPYLLGRSPMAARRIRLPARIGRGLGAPLSPGQQQIAGIAATGATATASILVALGTIGGPVGAAVAGLAAIGIGIANLFGGCGQTCVVATQIDNRLGDLLTQNFNAYMSAPVHYRSLQLAALNNFDTLWNAFQQACSNAGVLAYCVTDRQAGACRWRVAPFGWTQASGTWQYVSSGPPGSGTVCWNWFSGMRDPIANDPTVVPDPSPATAVAAAASPVLSVLGVSPSATLGGFQISDLLLPAALFAAAAMM
jgi:hypothetical protein